MFILFTYGFIILVIPNANPTNNYLNPSNKNTPDIKSQLNSENLNKPYDPLDPKKFTLFSNSMNIPKNEGKIYNEKK